MQDDPEFVVQFDTPPPLPNAPGWAQELARRLHDTERRQQTDRQNANDQLAKVNTGLADVVEKLGHEPDSDGRGGTGLIGDTRKMARDLRGLMDLKTMGVGAVGAVTLFGALILLGLIHWVQAVTGHAR